MFFGWLDVRLWVSGLVCVWFVLICSFWSVCVFLGLYKTEFLVVLVLGGKFLG